MVPSGSSIVDEDEMARRFEQAAVRVRSVSLDSLRSLQQKSKRSPLPPPLPPPPPSARGGMPGGSPAAECSSPTSPPLPPPPSPLGRNRSMTASHLPSVAESSPGEDRLAAQPQAAQLQPPPPAPGRTRSNTDGSPALSAAAFQSPQPPSTFSFSASSVARSQAASTPVQAPARVAPKRPPLEVSPVVAALCPGEGARQRAATNQTADRCRSPGSESGEWTEWTEPGSPPPPPPPPGPPPAHTLPPRAGGGGGQLTPAPVVVSVVKASPAALAAAARVQLFPSPVPQLAPSPLAHAPERDPSARGGDKRKQTELSASASVSASVCGTVGASVAADDAAHHSRFVDSDSSVDRSGGASDCESQGEIDCDAIESPDEDCFVYLPPAGPGRTWRRDRSDDDDDEEEEEEEGTGASDSDMGGGAYSPGEDFDNGGYEDDEGLAGEDLACLSRPPRAKPTCAPKPALHGRQTGPGGGSRAAPGGGGSAASEGGGHVGVGVGVVPPQQHWQQQQREQHQNKRRDSGEEHNPDDHPRILLPSHLSQRLRQSRSAVEYKTVLPAELGGSGDNGRGRGSKPVMMDGDDGDDDDSDTSLSDADDTAAMTRAGRRAPPQGAGRRVRGATGGQQRNRRGRETGGRSGGEEDDDEDGETDNSQMRGGTVGYPAATVGMRRRRSDLADVVAWERGRSLEEYYAVRLAPMLPMKPPKSTITVRGASLRSASTNLLRSMHSAFEMRWNLRVFRRGEVDFKPAAGALLRWVGRKWGVYARRFAVLSNFGLHVYADEAAYSNGDDALFGLDYDSWVGVHVSDRCRVSSRPSADARAAAAESGEGAGCAFALMRGDEPLAKLRVGTAAERREWLLEIATLSLCAVISGTGSMPEVSRREVDVGFARQGGRLGCAQGSGAPEPAPLRASSSAGAGFDAPAIAHRISNHCLLPHSRSKQKRRPSVHEH